MLVWLTMPNTEFKLFSQNYSISNLVRSFKKYNGLILPIMNQNFPGHLFTTFRKIHIKLNPDGKKCGQVFQINEKNYIINN